MTTRLRSEHQAVVHVRIDGCAVAVGVRCAADAVTEIAYLPPDTPERAPRTALERMACEQLRAYAADPHFVFDLPLAPRGTDFQRAVWEHLRRIPCGTTRTYGHVALAVGAPARAVGQACGDNPFPVVVPCHRVVGVRSLGGFAHTRGGYLLDIKQRLLVHEGALMC